MLFGLPGMTQMAFMNGLLQRLACFCGSVEASIASKRSIVAPRSRGTVGGAALFAGNGRRDAGVALAERPDRVVTQRPRFSGPIWRAQVPPRKEIHRLSSRSQGGRRQPTPRSVR